MKKTILYGYNTALFICGLIFLTETDGGKDNYCSIMIMNTKTSNLMKMHIHLHVTELSQEPVKYLYLAFCYRRETDVTKLAKWKCGESLNDTYNFFMKIPKRHLKTKNFMKTLFPTTKLLYEMIEGKDSPIDITSIKIDRKQPIISIFFWYSHYQVGTYACSFLRFDSQNKITKLIKLGDISEQVKGTLKRRENNVILAVRSKTKLRPFFPDEPVTFTCDWEEDHRMSNSIKTISVNVSK